MAEPRTIQGEVNGTGVVSYTLPPGVFQYVQSIRVEIDNTAGGDARPELDISEQAGAVIATKRQGEAIPAGDTGSATWALRLDDESDLSGFIRYVFANIGAWLSIDTTGLDPSNNFGIRLRALGFPVIIQGEGIWLRSKSGDVTAFLHDATDTFVVTSDVNPGDVHFEVVNNGDTVVHLKVGKALRVLNHLNQEIFLVNEDGSLQGKTGKALTFNL